MPTLSKLLNGMSLFKRILSSVHKPEQPLESPLVFDPGAAGYIEDPYPILKRLSDSSPVFRADFGPWILTRFEDVNSALADKRLGNAPAPYAVVNIRNRDKYFCADVANNLIAFMDPPEHGQPRKLLARAFHTYLKSGLVNLDARAEQQASAIPAGEDFDFIETFATPYSLGVIRAMFGFPKADEPQLKQWTDHFFYLFTQIPSVEIRASVDENLKAFRAYMLERIAERKEVGGSDFLAAVVQANEANAGERLPDTLIADNCMLIFADGIENVDSGIANAVVCMLRDAGGLEAVRKTDLDLDLLVDECLRFESPAQFIGRVVLEDFDFGGQELQQGQAVLLMLASANRDASRFDEPDRFVMNRSPNPYLSFGRGKHSCLGGAMVQMEMTAALKAILGRFESLELVDHPLDWQYRMGHRWLGSLRLRGTLY